MNTSRTPAIAAELSKSPPAQPARALRVRVFRKIRRLLKRWPTFLPLGLFAAIWIAELFVVQDMTLAPDYIGGARFAFFAPKIRLALDVLFVCFSVALLNRIGLVAVSFLADTTFLALLTYSRHLYRPLSLIMLSYNWREGLSMGAFSWELINRRDLLWLSAALIAKLLAVYAAPPGTRWRFRLSIAGACLTGYALLFLVANVCDPLDRIASRRSLGRLGIIRGYAGPWLAEIYYLGDQRVLEAAIARRAIKSDQLSPREIPLQIEPHLVIIQAESLDFHVVGHCIDGREVTPFLNQLREEAMYFRVRAFHYLGSFDADFTMLTDAWASPNTHPYNLPGYPFDDALPKVLQRHGYRTVALHGNYGSFYNRARAFEKMGFDEILFREQLEGRGGLRAERFGVRDDEVLNFALRQLRQSRDRTCQFIITLTSHTPYTFVGSRSDDIYPDPQSAVEYYFNSMRYLDDSLRDFVTGLPKYTTVVIYGDHGTEVRSDNFVPDREGAKEYVPCFIYDTERNLSELQKSRHEPISYDGSLNLLDIATYLRGCIEASEAPPAAAPQKDGKNALSRPAGPVLKRPEWGGATPSAGKAAEERRTAAFYSEDSAKAGQSAAVTSESLIEVER